MSERTVFETIGGMPTFRAIAEAFYRGVEADPVLRPMYPDQLDIPIDSLTLFLAQYFGGPTTYSDQRGHPRLRMRHARFHIGQAERNAWMRHMLAALDEAGVEEPCSSVMRQYFAETSTFLINRNEQGGVE